MHTARTEIVRLRGVPISGDAGDFQDRLSKRRLAQVRPFASHEWHRRPAVVIAASDAALVALEIAANLSRPIGDEKPSNGFAGEGGVPACMPIGKA